MNYIRHLNAALNKIALDDRLNPTHVSLYMALFFFWNLNRFNNPVSIARGEILKFSKIGSRNTYTKCLKELHTFQYLEYLPSKNPFKGSRVNMYIFDNSTVTALSNASPKSVHSGVTVVSPSINSNKPIKPKRKNSHVENFKDYSEPL